MNPSKAIRLLALLPKRPVEFYDRVMTVVDVKRERHRAAFGNNDRFIFTDALRLVLGISNDEVAQILAESELQSLEEKVSLGIAAARVTGPFTSAHNGNFCLAKSIYVLCRVLSPNIVLETGVAYGVTSAFALQAMAVNRKGTLISVDLPPLGGDADRHVGVLIPEGLKENWRLHRGPAKRILPGLINSIKEVDIFVHDSLHTYRHMNFEFETAWPRVRPGGAVVADNVDLNQAFEDFIRRARPAFSAVVQEDDTTDLFGIMMKRT
jgi:Methyltransferase domain